MSKDRAERIEELGTSGGIVVARAAGRRFPGVLIQGDTMFALLSDLEEEAPKSEAYLRVLEWLTAYETVMAADGLALPYMRKE